MSKDTPISTVPSHILSNFVDNVVDIISYSVAEDLAANFVHGSQSTGFTRVVTIRGQMSASTANLIADRFRIVGWKCDFKSDVWRSTVGDHVTEFTLSLLSGW